MTDISHMKSLLDQRLASLTRRIDVASGALRAAHSKDWDDQAIEREGEEVLESLSQSDAQEKAQIEAALKRIEAGSYGSCTQCGENISADRLMALPATPLCRTCAHADEDLFENVPL